MKKLVIFGLQLGLLAGLSGLAVAQDTVTVTAKPLTDSDIALLRQNVQSKKMEIITKTMQFTDAEAAAFWPVYRDYANEQQKIGETRYQLIKEYAQSYGQMTDDQAAALTSKADDVEKSLLELRENYWPKFAKALSPKRAAKFYQVDRRLTLMVDLELSTEVPLLD
jgi:DNA anti-recombination protein RmuC